MNHTNKFLFKEKYITKHQYTFLETIRKEETISLYYELRLLLYIGIMLFTGGLGYLVYENIGSVGHLLMMTLLCIAIVVGFYHISKHSKPYTNNFVQLKLVYLDYLLLLVSLLIIGLFTYIQIYFDWVSILASWSSYISASILFFMAYRYDNRALLSMGIAALSAALGFSITPIDWTNNEWFSTNHTYTTAILLGVGLYTIGYLSEKKEIKRHFKFTYQNFGSLSYCLGCILGIFYTDAEIAFTLLTIISSIPMLFYTWKTKEFLFFLYSSISLYIAFTYLLFIMLNNTSDGYILLIYYLPFICIGYVLFLINKKSHFSHD